MSCAGHVLLSGQPLAPWCPEYMLKLLGIDILLLLLLLSRFSRVRLLATPWTAAHQSPPGAKIRVTERRSLQE